ncbi:hypothetical protein MANY_23580 [Mycolicibacterium anyangense]|uniref:Uncharacterized protein n=1 Tax=Mycolicibacterium anyangense TaxID=1431246 RepID=A0A6N4WCT7_9MYCO|nr:hypothetical protein MANY_23580 [Mycolicibacterium anyangense]
MRRGIGAIVITGVVLVGATVVVANPVLVPQSDVRVPPVELSAGSAAPGSMLDRAFLDAIAQQPTDSAPVSVVKRMLAELAANAALLGGKAVEEVVDAHTAIAAAPAPAAVSLAAAPVAMVPPGLLDAVGPVNLPSMPAAVPDIDPTLRQALTSLVADVGYVGGQIVVAALATGALVSSEPRLIVDAVAALAAGDLHTAAVTAITAVSAPVVAPLIVADAVNTVVRNRFVDVPPTRTQEQASVRLRPTATASGVRRHTAAALSSVGPAAASPNGATDLRDGNKTSPRSAELQAKAGAAIRSARQSADRFGDAVRTALGPRAAADAATSTDN